jgi:hypothetical protein
MAVRKLNLITIPAILLGALTACDADPGVTPESTGIDCVAGEWTADLDDIATQMAAFFEANGTGEDLIGTVTGSEQMILVASGGIAGSSTAQDDATFVFTGTRDGTPLTITVVRAGAFIADWGIVDETLMFSDFTSEGYQQTITIERNGVTTTLPPQSSGAFAEDIPITTICSGDVMTMKPDISPFTTTWNRGVDRP